MKAVRALCMIIIITLLLTGCWDQNLMKDATIVQAISIDRVKDNKLFVGVTVPELGEGGTQQSSSKTKTVFVTAKTLGEAMVILDREVSGNLDTSKNKLLFFGEDFARKDIFPYLDILYRNPRNSLGSELVVVKGKIADVLRVQSKNEPNVSRYILSLINSAEAHSVIPKQSVQTIASEILDPGEDIVLPYLAIEPNRNAIEVDGVALFNGKKFTGITLAPLESTLLQIMRSGHAKKTIFVMRNDKTSGSIQDISFSVKTIRKRIKVIPEQDGHIRVDINAHYKIVIMEYPKGDVKEYIPQLKKELSAYFVDLTNRVTDKLREADCDAFGIGRRLIALHPQVWAKLDKKNYFQNVTFYNTADIESIQFGILD